MSAGMRAKSEATSRIEAGAFAGFTTVIATRSIESSPDRDVPNNEYRSADGRAGIVI